MFEVQLHYLLLGLLINPVYSVTNELDILKVGKCIDVPNQCEADRLPSFYRPTFMESWQKRRGAVSCYVNMETSRTCCVRQEIVTLRRPIGKEPCGQW